MKKRYVLLVLIVFIFQLFVSNFSYVKAEANTSICAGPSETMSLYFEFQNKMKSVLLNSEINERRFDVHVGAGGLFSQQLLSLKKGNTAIDLVASSLWNRTTSVVSAATTSVVLIALASVSAAQSSTVGLSILFRDRPIVRDYKTMMDIETELFDVAYFRSKQINITRPIDGDMHDAINSLVEEYQDSGLLAKGGDVTKLKSDATIVDIIWDLLVMNATMEVFILYDSQLVLDNYRGCMNRSRSDCIPVLKFSDEAKAKLKSDYKGTFGKCNSNFKSSMSKIGSSFLDEQKSGWQDVKDAMGRLKQALGVGGKKNSNKKKKECDNVSRYKMAQITAFFGDDWSCDEADKLYKEIPAQKKSRQEAQKQQRQDERNAQKQERQAKREQRTNERINNKKTTAEKKQEWFYIYGKDVEYNPEYSLEMYEDFIGVYNSIKSEYNQSLKTAEIGDLSRQFIKIKGLIDQIQVIEDQSEILKNSLKQIADYQCAG